MLVFGLSTKENEGPRMDNNDYKLYIEQKQQRQNINFLLSVSCVVA